MGLAAHSGFAGVQSTTLTVHGTEIQVPTAEIFRELDKLEGVAG